MAQSPLSPDLRFDNYNSNDNFSNDFVSNIYRDHFGYLWVCSNGLYRFDGKNATHYTNFKNGTGNLRDNYVDNVTEDNQHRLWVSGIGGLSYYDQLRDKFTYTDIDSAHKVLYAYALCFRQDQLWFVCNFGLCHIDLNTLKIKTTSLKDISSPISTYEGRPGELLICHYGGGYYVYNLTKDSYELKSLPGNASLQVYRFLRQGNRFFIGTNKGVWLLEDGKNAQPELIKGTEQWQILSMAIVKTHDSVLWLGTNDHGLIAFDTKRMIPLYNYVHSDLNPYSIPYSFISELFPDRDNNLWIVCEQAFSCINFTNQMFKTQYVPLKSVTSGNNLLRCMVQDKYDSSTVWIGGTGSGIYRVNWNTKQIEEHINPLENTQSGSTILDMVQTGKFTWVLNLYTRLAIWNSQNHKLEIIADLKQNKNEARIVSLFKQGDSIIYVATDKGLYRYHTGNKSFKNIWVNNTTVIDLKYNLQFGISYGNNLWMATRGGLVNFNATTEQATLYKVKHADSVSANHMSCIDVDNNGFIWCTSRNGLARFDTSKKTFYFYDSFINLHNLDCKGIVVKNNIAWVTTDAGLLCFDIHSKKSNIFPLVNSESFCISPFSHVGQYLVMKFRNAYSYFNPYDLLNQPLPSPPLIEQVLINNDTKFIPGNQPLLEVEYHKNTFNFSFTAFNYNNPAGIRFRYKIEGIDHDWNYTELHNVNYISVPPGKYHLKIQSGNGLNEWNTQITDFPFVVLPPFWLTIWFRILMLIVVVAIIYFIFMNRLRHILELETIRRKIAADFHDDLGSTLSSISIYSEVAKKNADTNVARTQQLLTDIGEKTRSIIVSMNDMIWAVKPENDKLLNLVQYMEDFGVGVAEAKNMAFSLTLANDMGELKLKMVTRKNLYYIFKESVNNSVKYSKATSIKVEIAKVKKEIVMVITDNGIGFDFETLKKGNGLTNIKKRGEEMGGRVEISSYPGTGTVVKVFLRTA